LGEGVTREKLLELFVQAPDAERVRALVSLARPGLDYGFFQALSERISSAKEAEAQRLTDLRSQLLELTEVIDQAQQERVGRAAGLLESLLDAQDLGTAVQAALPLIDELFLSILQANLRAARESADQPAFDRLKRIEDMINQAILASMPPGLRVAQQVLQFPDDEAQRFLEQSRAEIDEDTLTALLSAAQRLESQEQAELAERLRRLHRYALRLSMRSKLGA
jgi:uncharacterized membrane protein